MITLSSKDYEWSEGLTVKALLAQLGTMDKYRGIIDTQGVVVSVNGKLVLTDQYGSTGVSREDIVGILSFVAGG